MSGAPNEGEEDLACAELMVAKLQGIPYAPEKTITTVRSSRAAARHRAGDVDFPTEDVDCATAIDALDFAMRAERGHSGWIAKRFLVDE